MTAGAYQAAPPAYEPITEAMLLSLRKTRPWVRLLSILGMLIALFIVAVGVGVGLAGPFLAGDKAPAAFMVGAGVFYIILGLLYLIPSLYLFRYAAAISDALKVQPRGPSVERALELQKSFWKFVGIFVLLGIVLYFVAIGVAIVMGPKIAGAIMQGIPGVM